MFKKPEDARMTQEESERYGKLIDAKNAQLEHVEVEEKEEEKQQEQRAPQLTEEEIKERVGEQNYKNAIDSDITGSINS